MRRMITEKEADKLRFIKDGDGEGGQYVSFVYSGLAPSIDISDTDISLYAPNITMWDNDGVNDHIIIQSDNTTVKTPLVVIPNNDIPYLRVESDGIHMELPIEDPHKKGYLWNDNGTIKISLG